MGKKIPGYPGYEATKDGHVISSFSGNYLSEKEFQGSLRVTVTHNGKRESVHVRTLIALAFIPNPENKPWVENIDGNIHNNSVENLKWVTMQEKAIDQPYYENGVAAMKVARSKAVSMCDLKTHKVIRRFDSSSDAARYLGDIKKNSLINRCANAKIDKAYGYFWKWAS